MPSAAEFAAAPDDYRVLRRVPKRDCYAPLPADTSGFKRIVFADTEGTGLIPKEDKMIELAAMAVEFDPATGRLHRILNAYEGVEDPGIPIKAEAAKVNGFTDEMVKGQHFHDGRIETVFADADLVIAHNAGYDRGMMEARFPWMQHLRFGCSLNDVKWRERGLDSAVLSHLLAFQCGMFYDGHKAMEDVRAMVELLSTVDEDGVPLMQPLWQRAKGIELHLWVKPEYSKLSVIKTPRNGRKYEWAPDPVKMWHITVPREESTAEVEWLHQDVFDGRPFQMKVDVMDATCRFTDRTRSSEEMVFPRPRQARVEESAPEMAPPLAP
jgi:DNA polymerase-3 subunit epsilon